MASARNPQVVTRRQLAIRLSILLVALALLGFACAIALPPEKLCIVWPTLAAVTIFMVFSIILRSWVGDNLLGELGFLYLALAVAYTIFPAFTFLITDLNLASGWVWENLSLLLPAPSELAVHLWRHVLFLFGITSGYLLVRGRKTPQAINIKDTEGKDGLTIVFLFGMITICVLCISLMSAPVSTYIDNYTRYDHLSWFSRKFVSVCARMKEGLYVALITFLFINYKKYKLLIYASIIGMSTYELVYSFGSRIESFFVLLMTICLYHYFVKPVSLKRGLLVCVAITVFFSAVEVFRSYDFDMSQAEIVASDRGIQPASEFGAVYFTGFHLYSERTQGTMPPKEWPMFFNDFISLVTPNDFVRWNPQHWYARAYFPDAIVPPETLGPIADSAIWGGEIDLLLRSLINGAFFAYLVRWFISRKDRWWGVAIYVFCYATCIMTLKYSIFYHLNPLLKTFLPTIFLIEMLRRFLPSRRESGLEGGLMSSRKLDQS
jgi:hypothetical protein